MVKILTRRFFERPTLVAAQSLLGKYLVRRVAPTLRGRSGSRLVAGMITEVEAYDGPRDRASHASRGLTKRNAPMFGPAGYWYVYFTYGVHWMLNIVTREKGYPAAILIRGVKSGNAMARHSTKAVARGLSLDGPAKITKFLKIDKRFNNKKAIPKSGLWIEDRGVRIGKGQITKSKRVGVDYAGPVWAEKRYRFFLK